jgi:hypothetical protein
MFILLDKNGQKWETPCWLDGEVFDTHDEAVQFADENDLVDVAIFEFKGFV